MDISMQKGIQLIILNRPCHLFSQTWLVTYSKTLIIGTTLWKKGGLDLYLENSPLFKADQVTTPLLIMHNDNDGAVPWYQGIEYFMALRRLGTKRILLELEAEQKQHKLLIFK